MFLKKNFLFYVSSLNKYYIIKAKDESDAVAKLCRHFQGTKYLNNFVIIHNTKTL